MTQPIYPGVVDPLTGQPSVAPPPQPFTPVPVIDPSKQPNVQPVPGSEQYSGNSYRPADTLPGLGAAEPFPIPTPGLADQQGAGGGAPPFPMDPRGAADRQPAMIPQTVTETSKSTTGPDAATTANINAATGDANAAAQAAGTAKVGELNATADLERKQSQDAYGRGVNNYFESLAQMQTQDEIVRETSTRLENAAKFKPDRTQLFQGDTGVLFGISAAVAAMAGGWLMGQGLTGGRNPYLDTVMKMIDDNANDQINANSQVYQELTRRLGTAEGAKRELKARMLESVNQTIEAQSRFEKADLVQKGAASIMADVQKETAKNRMEAAKLTGQTTTKTVQSKTQMVQNPAATGGVDVTNPQEYERVGKVGAIQNLVNDAEGLAKSGDLAASVGLFDEAWDWAADATRTRSPGAAKVAALKQKWELAMRANWKTEPNGQQVQERLSSISFPRSDSEIPFFLQNVREALNTADPGGKYRVAARSIGQQPNAVESRRIPVVR
jgi:hypothetical protein